MPAAKKPAKRGGASVEDPRSPLGRLYFSPEGASAESGWPTWASSRRLAALAASSPGTRRVRTSSSAKTIC